MRGSSCYATLFFYAMKPIAVWYHSLFFLGDPPVHLPAAPEIVAEQMAALKTSGLEDAAAEIHIGVNGTKDESEPFAGLLFPEKAQVTYHGLQCRNELRTILMLEEWVKTHPNWNVLYFHSKGATHAPDSHYGHNISAPWRIGMMQDLVLNWRTCCKELDAGHDIVCSHFMWRMADGTQHIPCGNFLWLTSDFAAKLPSFMLRDRLRVSGLDSVESRFEAEVYWGNGPTPNVKQWRPHGGGGIP